MNICIAFSPSYCAWNYYGNDYDGKWENHFSKKLHINLIAIIYLSLNKLNWFFFFRDDTNYVELCSLFKRKKENAQYWFSFHQIIFLRLKFCFLCSSFEEKYPKSGTKWAKTKNILCGFWSIPAWKHMKDGNLIQFKRNVCRDREREWKLAFISFLLLHACIIL